MNIIIPRIPVEDEKDAAIQLGFDLLSKGMKNLETETESRIVEVEATIVKPALRGGFNVDDIRYYGTLANAIASIPSTQSKTLIITFEQNLAGNLTIPSNISMEIPKGGLIDGAFTLTINGPFSAGDYQVFGPSVTVVFGTSGETNPTWFRAAGGEWGAPLNRALACRQNRGNKILRPPDASLSVSTLITPAYSNIYWSGGTSTPSDDIAQRLLWIGAVGGTMLSSTVGVTGVHIRNLFFDGAHITKWCWEIDLMRRCTFRNVTWARSVGFCYATNCYYSHVFECTAFLQTPGTYIGGVGQVTLAAWQDVCNNGFRAPVTFQSNANTMRIEGLQFAKVGAYELPAGGAAISQMLLLAGQPMKISLPRFESMDSDTIPTGAEDATKVNGGNATGFSAGFTQLTTAVISGASSSNTSSHLLYGKISKAAGVVTVSLYTNSNRIAGLVATGSVTDVANAIIILHPQNGSGLHGQVTSNYTGDSATWTYRANYMTITQIVQIGGGGPIEIDAIYMEAVFATRFCSAAAKTRGGISIGQIYMEDCYFSGSLFDSSSIKELFIGSIVGIGCTQAGSYVADLSASTRIEIVSAEFHNRYIVIGGVNYSDETLGKLGMASTPGSLPILYRPQVASGLAVTNSSDAISDYILVAPGTIRDGMGRVLTVGRYEEVNALTAKCGWLFRPPATAASYNVCCDAMGLVYIENQASVVGSQEQGKIILATFTTNGAGVVTVFTAVSSPKATRGIETPLTGGLTVPGVLSAGGNIVMTENDEARVIRQDSSDGSDSRRLIVTGGGQTGNTRGGALTVGGNEHASLPGFVQLSIGNVAGAKAQFIAQGSEQGYMDNNGLLTWLQDIAIGTAGKGVNIKEGSNARMGVATLVAGVAVVSTTAVTANSRILLTRQTIGGTLGTSVDVTARTGGTSFTITSQGSILDTSTVAWVILEPA